MCKSVFFPVVCCVLVIACGLHAQESCYPYVAEECQGDPMLFECMQLLTIPSTLQGGATATIGQELCFRVGSPLFSDLMVFVDRGTVAIETLKEGDVIGEIFFSANLADFGEDCPVGNQAMLRIPLAVVSIDGAGAVIEAIITEASDPLVVCLLNYDPQDAEHNFGKILEGELYTAPGGGFELDLKLAELAPEASYPGLTYSDLQSSGAPVPMFFRPMWKDGLFTLPASGTLTVTTTVEAFGAQTERVEEFTIEGGLSLFRRGDVNDDGQLNIADAIAVLSYLFADAPLPPCPDAADANDDGQLNIADAIATLSYLFAGGTMPAPSPGCGTDPTPSDLPPCEATSC